MPELPEVETVRQGLISAMQNKAIERVVLNRADLRVPITEGFTDSLTGSNVQNLIRRGKYLIILCDNDVGFVVHLGMSGRMAIHDNYKHYEPVKHDHALFYMAGGGLVVLNDPRRFGMLYLTSAKNWETEKPFCNMGPEPLGNGFSGDVLYDRLKKKRSPIKTALLDQNVVSGVGNIYACEALYDASIHPESLACTLSQDDCARLVVTVRDVLSRAIASGGSSLRDYKQTDGSLGYFQHSFAVYDREGVPCPVCAKEMGDNAPLIERIVQANRSTFFCPRHQKKTGV